MGTLDLANLPGQARYESSCNTRTSLESRPRLWPLQKRKEVTIYLTSSGDICLYGANISEFPQSSIFNLSEVREKPLYHGKKVKSWFPFHAGTLYIAFLGILWSLFVLFTVFDYMTNYDYYYYLTPEESPAETASGALSFLVVIPLLLILYLLIFKLPEYILKRLTLWSDAEKIDFILKNDEHISFYGKFPMENRINLHRYAWWGFLLVAAPIAVVQPQFLLWFVLIEALVLAVFFVITTMLTGLFYDPDENKGSVGIKGLKNFCDDVINLSIPAERAAGKEGSTAFHFEHLVDRLSDEVASLSARLQVHEKALDEATNEKWRYTLRTPTVDQGLHQIRKCAERVLYQRVIRLSNITLGPRAGLDEMKSILEKNKKITSKPLSDLEVILAKTSPGSHATFGYAESDDDYITALRALANLVEWHFDNSDNTAAIETFPEPN